jgi:hypothetical protein
MQFIGSQDLYKAGFVICVVKDCCYRLSFFCSYAQLPVELNFDKYFKATFKNVLLGKKQDSRHRETLTTCVKSNTRRAYV